MKLLRLIRRLLSVDHPVPLGQPHYAPVLILCLDCEPCETEPAWSRQYGARRLLIRRAGVWCCSTCGSREWLLASSAVPAVDVQRVLAAIEWRESMFTTK